VKLSLIRFLFPLRAGSCGGRAGIISSARSSRLLLLFLAENFGMESQSRGMIDVVTSRGAIGLDKYPVGVIFLSSRFPFNLRSGAHGTNLPGN